MMDIRQVLNFRFRKDDLLILDDGGISKDVQRKLKHIHSDLVGIQRRHTGYAVPEKHRLVEAYKLFRRHVDKGESALVNAFESSTMVRRLAWALRLRPEDSTAIVDDVRDLDMALLVIRTRWRPSMVAALVDTLLWTWDRPIPAGMVRTALARIIEKPSPARRVQEFTKQKTYFLEVEGPLAAARDLIDQDVTLEEILRSLAISDRARFSPYFAELAGEYCRAAMQRQSFEDHISSSLDFLGVDEDGSHAPSSFLKRCLTPMILRLATGADTRVRDRVQKAAFQKIGDPSHEALWAPWAGATSSEKDELHAARMVLNSWIIRRFITAFFAKIVMDTDRRQFWLGYSSHITRFKVYTDRYTLRRLRGDSRIEPYLKGRCGTMTSAGQSALLMEIKDRVFVEFSHTGAACYVYDSNDDYSPEFGLSYCSEQDLKHSSLSQLLYRTYLGDAYDLRSTGRVIHREGWQYGFRTWFQEELGIEQDAVVG